MYLQSFGYIVGANEACMEIVSNEIPMKFMKHASLTITSTW